MSDPDYPHAEYLGDAVYADFDGYGIQLRLNDHRSSPLLTLEPETLQALFDYNQRLRSKLATK